MKKKEEKQSFKQSLERLEEIAQKLEDENLDLEEAVRLYEEGVQLNAFCLTKLQEAELKITQLKNSLSVTKTEPKNFQDESEERHQ
jgi:exodeoxyribonuclease VII small subunit